MVSVVEVRPQLIRDVLWCSSCEATAICRNDSDRTVILPISAGESAGYAKWRAAAARSGMQVRVLTPATLS